MNVFTQASNDLMRYVIDPNFVDLDRSVTHMRLAAMSRQHAPVDEKLLRHIYNRLQMRIVNTDQDVQVREAKLSVLRDEVWPELFGHAKENLGMAAFLLENALHSDCIARFLLNVWKCPAKAVLPAHGVAEDILKNPIAVPRTDPMFPYCYDQSYRMIQYRTRMPQSELRQMKKVIFLGGGLLPELWTYDFLLKCGQNQLQVVVYDQDDGLPSYLEQILSGKLSDFGIDYRVEDFESAFVDANQQGIYDGVVMNGVLSYRLKDLEKIFRGVAGLLKPGGKFFFDLQLKHPVLLFDVLTLDWPATMETLDNVTAAVSLVDIPLGKAGFRHMIYDTEPYDPKLGEMPAGVITVATKGDNG